MSDLIRALLGVEPELDVKHLEFIGKTEGDDVLRQMLKVVRRVSYSKKLNQRRKNPDFEVKFKKEDDVALEIEHLDGNNMFNLRNRMGSVNIALSCDEACDYMRRVSNWDAMSPELQAGFIFAVKRIHQENRDMFIHESKAPFGNYPESGE